MGATTAGARPPLKGPTSRHWRAARKGGSTRGYCAVAGRTARATTASGARLKDATSQQTGRRNRDPWEANLSLRFDISSSAFDISLPCCHHSPRLCQTLKRARYHPPSRMIRKADHPCQPPRSRFLQRDSTSGSFRMKRRTSPTWAAVEMNSNSVGLTAWCGLRDGASAQREERDIRPAGRAR